MCPRRGIRHAQRSEILQWLHGNFNRPLCTPALLLSGCYASVSTQGAEKTRLTRYAGERGGSLSACDWGAIMQKQPFLLTRIEEKSGVKGKRLTPLYVRRGAALQLYAGLLLLLQSDIVVPCAHMMNESPCDRSSWLTRSLQQTKSPP